MIPLPFAGKWKYSQNAGVGCLRTSWDRGRTIRSPSNSRVHLPTQVSHCLPTNRNNQRLVGIQYDKMAYKAVSTRERKVKT